MPPHVHVHPDGTSLRDPSRLFYQSDYIRRLIIASYWLFIIAAIPLWWHITSIERLSLPTARVHAQAANHLRFPVQIQLENVQDPSISTSLQKLLDDRIHKSQGLDVQVRHQNDPANPIDSYVVRAAEGVPSANERHLTHPVRPATLSKLADLLTLLLVPPTDAHRVAQYSPRYRLAFTLLNEDAAAGGAISGWDISGAISRHLSPLLTPLSVLHNFTIESQVQFHAPLAFSPTSLHDGSSYGLTPEDLTVFVNSAEWSLSSSVSNDPVLHFIVFVPSASRRPLKILDSNGLPSSSNAFLLPQWGGIVIYNPPSVESELQQDTNANAPLPPSALHALFSTFATQLLSLLGVPNLPPDISIASASTSTTQKIPSDLQTTDALTGWQLDALLRRRTSENAKGAYDTLQSIVKLVDQIENMPVGEDVRGDVLDSLSALEELYTPSLPLPSTLHHSSTALTLASRAFFSPKMLALLYFPAEHKYAVYSPLFASATIPLAAAAIREVVAWRKQRTEAVGVQ
ncbi:GPI transamidase component PIG-S [Favolaschia claudopus]|uniref:GPI transamidase component PIG-S n=1 Tax=Favolaschia claudopus TaxID=2862362 RepID=A0AAW0D1E2_9AGAR